MRNKRLIIIFSILLSITVIVLLSSIIFSVKTLTTYCYYYKDTELELGQTATLSSQVLDAAGIKKGSSIFLINDSKVIASVEEKVAGVHVINVERKFPNRVTINYVRMYNYFEADYGGWTYVCRCDGRVTSKIPSGSPSEGRIRLITKISKQYEIGDYLFQGAESALLNELVTSLEMLNLAQGEAARHLEYIDITKSENIVYMGTRTGVTIALLGRNNLLPKLQNVFSLFLSSDFDRSKYDSIIATADMAFAKDSSQNA